MATHLQNIFCYEGKKGPGDHEDLIEDKFSYIATKPDVKHNDLTNKKSKIPKKTIPVPFTPILRKDDNLKQTFNCPITKKMIRREIRKLDIKKAPGIDGIRNKVIKLLEESLSDILHVLFSASLKMSYHPKRWKEVSITMLLKPNKDKQELGSYRPVSLLSNLGKLLERCITYLIYNLAEENKIINKSQSGFRRGRSTHDQIVRILDDIISGFNLSKTSTAVFLDVEKAFDKVWHKGLIVKLHELGISVMFTHWILSFLNERLISVKVEDSHSKTFTPVCGVPQGSPISPLLFILYVSDIPSSSKCKQSQFADDIAVWASANNKKNALRSSIQDNLQNQLDKLYQWCNKWRIGLNPSKTIQINFFKKISKPVHLKLNGTTVNVQTSTKFLGVTLDQRLSLEEHVENTLKRCNLRLLQLYGLKHKPSSKVLLVIYKSFIRSLVDYCPVVTLCLKDYLLNKLELMQNKFIRFAFHLPRTTTKANLLARSGLVSIQTRCENLSKTWFENASSTNESIIDVVHSSKYFEGFNNRKPPMKILKDLIEI